MSGFTPGPWKLETVQTQIGCCHKIGDFPSTSSRKNHACVYVDGYGPYQTTDPRPAELLANARLIAAAPDLLEACQAFLARYHNHMVNADLLFSDIAEKATAAVSKALEGQ